MKCYSDSQQNTIQNNIKKSREKGMQHMESEMNILNQKTISLKSIEELKDSTLSLL